VPMPELADTGCREHALKLRGGELTRVSERGLKWVQRRVKVARLALAASGGSSLRYIIYESSGPARPFS
jgi:hypothetical protein